MTLPGRGVVDPFVPVLGDAAARERAGRFLRERVIAARDFPDTAYDDGGCWAAALPRAHARHLHGMMFLADWHQTVLEDGPDGALTAAVGLFLRWSEVVAELADTSMAYHDETTAQRLLQLCRLLDDHASVIDTAARERLLALATSTAELLASDDFYAGSNNHGMFQDLALLRFAAGSEEWLPRTRLLSRVVEVAVERLLAYFTTAFTADGVHVENSPAYHLMVSRSLRDVIPVVRAVAPDRADTLEHIYAGAERFAAHSVMPDGTIAPLGDSKVMTVARTGHSATFTGPAFRFATTGEGTPPAERTVVFPHGGYAMHRTAWGDPQAYLMTFKAAYLAQYHHHCDDLALTVFGRGRWLLSEAGPNGYDYADPRTRYAYSQHAHNVVVVDGRSLPRVDPEPGGVSLVDQTEEPEPVPRRGLGRLRDRLTRSRPPQTPPAPPPLLRVTGTNTRFADSRHDRTVTVTEPAGHLHVTVRDVVEHGDGREHDHEILWHVGPGVEVRLHEDGAELSVGESTVLALSWAGPGRLEAGLVRPRDSGRVQALRFPRFGRHEPATVIRVASRGTRLAVTTTIRAGDWLRLT